MYDKVGKGTLESCRRCSRKPCVNRVCAPDPSLAQGEEWFCGPGGWRRGPDFVWSTKAQRGEALEEG